MTHHVAQCDHPCIEPRTFDHQNGGLRGLAIALRGLAIGSAEVWNTKDSGAKASTPSTVATATEDCMRDFVENEEHEEGTYHLCS